MKLNTRVADALVSLEFDAFIGVELMQELRYYYKIPQEALTALQRRWEAIAEVQQLGARAKCRRYRRRRSCDARSRRLLRRSHPLRRRRLLPRSRLQ